jgi:hypothetical protein
MATNNLSQFRCPCCGHFTLTEEGHYEICPVCFWEDDPIQSQNEIFAGGANRMSLREARQNYKLLGAISADVLRHVSQVASKRRVR